jgi:hypothetical protein
MQERVFMKITWADEQPVEVIEDYPTWKHGKEVWTVVDDMRDGMLVPNSHDTKYSITWLEGAARESAWLTYGPRDDDPPPM